MHVSGDFRYRRWSVLVVLANLLLLCSTSVYAIDVLVVDQHNNPVKDAVVAIPTGSISDLDTSPAVMDQVDKQFVPQVLAIKQGSNVVFPNSDDIRHHVYSFSKPKRFEIKLYEGDPNKPIAFNKSGIVSLGCNIHDSMIGHIFVSPWPEFTTTDANGRANLNGNSQQLAVWHPQLKKAKKPVMLDIKSGDAMTTHKLVIKLAKNKKKKRRKKKLKLY